MLSPRALPVTYGHAGSPPAVQADGQVQAKLQLVVESSAAVDDALAILMCHSEGQVQVSNSLRCNLWQTPFEWGPESTWPGGF